MADASVPTLGSETQAMHINTEKLVCQLTEQIRVHTRSSKVWWWTHWIASGAVVLSGGTSAGVGIGGVSEKNEWWLIISGVVGIIGAIILKAADPKTMTDDHESRIKALDGIRGAVQRRGLSLDGAEHQRARAARNPTDVINWCADWKGTQSAPDHATNQIGGNAALDTPAAPNPNHENNATVDQA